MSHRSFKGYFLSIVLGLMLRMEPKKLHRHILLLLISMYSWTILQIVRYNQHLSIFHTTDNSPAKMCSCCIASWSIEATVREEIAISASTVMDVSPCDHWTCSSGKKPLSLWFGGTGAIKHCTGNILMCYHVVCTSNHKNRLRDTSYSTSPI